MTRQIPLTAIQDAVRSARSVLVAVGLDATICSLTDKPDLGYTSGRTATALQRLAATRNVILAVLSGGSIANLRSTMGVDAVFAGSDGLEISGKGFNFIHPEAERLAPQMHDVCRGVEEVLAPWPGAWVDDKRLTATVHVRNCAVDDWNCIRDAIRSVVRPIDDLFCLRGGRAAFEISPRIGWNKGSALKYIERELAMEDALTVCVGDDDTDEPMFHAVVNGISVRVGASGESDALYTLPDTAALTDHLHSIADTLDASTPLRSTSYRLSGSALASPVGIEG
jgi:trehalose 6-phosphate phosphatase